MNKIKDKSIGKQGILIFMCWLVYTVSYVSRYSYNSNQVVIISEYGITKAVAGLVGTFYFIAYGVGQVLNGIFSKRYNKRYFITVSLIISAIINLVIFFKPPFEYYKYLWLINGLSLSVLWSSLICILGERLDDKNLKRAVVVMCTPVALGTCISYGSSALFTSFNMYRLAFVLGFSCALVTGIIWFIFYNNFTNTGIYIKAEEKKVKTLEEGNNNSSAVRRSTMVILFILGFFAVINNFVKDGLNTWVPSILKESYGLSDSLSMVLTIVLPILGVFGAMTAVFVNAKTKNYTLTCGIFFVCSSIFVLFVILAMSSNISKIFAIIIILTSFGFLSLLMHGINNVITSIAPLEMRKVFSSGTLAGVLNGCAYVGSAISSFGMGAISDAYGWKTMFIILEICCIVVVVTAFIAFLIRLKTVKKI